MSLWRTRQSVWSGSSPRVSPSSRSSREATEMRSKALIKVGSGLGKWWRPHLARESRARWGRHHLPNPLPTLIRALLLISVASLDDRELGLTRGLEPDQTDWRVRHRLIRPVRYLRRT